MAFFLTKKQGKIIAAILIFIAIGLFFSGRKSIYLVIKHKKLLVGSFPKKSQQRAN